MHHVNIRTQMYSLACLLIPCTALAIEPCRIEMIDKENGWPVPLVELRTTHEARYVSDNLGLIAIDGPDLMGAEVWFNIEGHGYTVPKDGFSFQGVQANLTPGGKVRIELTRENIAKRLGRLTGGGKFSEGEKLGIPPLLPETAVFGCDSVSTVEFSGSLFSLWGDTQVPGYPLGIFHTSAATTPLHPLSKFEPPLAVPYQYFRDRNDKPRGVAVLPGEGPTWLTGLVTFPENHLVATYSKIKGFLHEYECGICVWDPASENFVPEKVVWKEADGAQPVTLKGHPVRWKDSNGKSWILFGDPFPSSRCPDDFESWKNPSAWENVVAPTSAQAEADGSEIKAHRGCIAWNSYKKRWISIFTQLDGKPSAVGEIWYAEAVSPLGPWEHAVKVLTHNNYTFYNPCIQSSFTPEDAKFILFEGTYTADFANHPVPTPRYNYNQVLYRLDLDDPRLRSR
jgi:hypothetical protein